MSFSKFAKHTIFSAKGEFNAVKPLATINLQSPIITLKLYYGF